MIKKFIFTSTWDMFAEAVDVIKKLIDSNKAHWAVGFLNEFSLYVEDDADINLKIKTGTDIIDEIVYLLGWYLETACNGTEITEKEILKTINASQETFSDEKELKQTVKNVQNKLELVKDAFDTDHLVIRYKLKRDAVNLKLSDFKYNIYAQNLPDKGRSNFALIHMTCKRNLKGFLQGIKALLTEHEQGESVTFICDKEDIDLLIALLNEIKQTLGES